MPKPRPLERIDRFAWMTRTAFFVLLAVVCARCVLTEMLRDPLPVLPGSAAPPRGVGPAAGIGLDLLLCIPAMLVLLRRLVDGDYRLRQTWSLWPLAGWGVWALLSTIWAADKFAALVNACHLIGAVGAMFAAIQIVRDAIHVRLVAGAVIGVMLLLVANGINKRLFDVPEMIRQWQDPASPNSRWQYMKDNNLEESDFQFVQVEKKLLGGELTGFSASANTYAAMIAVGLVVMLGATAQAAKEGRKWGPAAAGLAVLAAAFVLRHTHSRQAAFTPLLGLGALLLWRWRGEWISARASRAYWLVVAVFVLGAGALVGHALYHGTLPDRSLTFRWYYWVGAARMAAQQPVLGVGWMNFGSYYPSVRVAGATEEVQDPHNILVRAFAETGLIGGTLLVVWLMRMFWEMTCAGSSSASEGEDGYRATRRAGPLTWVLGLGAGAMGVNLIAGHDFTQSDAWLQLQLFYCAGGALVLAATLAASAGRGWPPEWNREPCEWTIRGCVAGAGVFFLHNLLDFAWSEPGPLCLFALLAGAAIGAKSPPDHAPRVRPVVFFTGTLAALGLVLVMLGAWFATCVAENSASRADARVRALSANAPVDAMAVVARDYASAFAAMPLNADYLLREARIHIWRGDRAAARAACERAIAANPRQPLYHLFRAEIELANERPDPRIVSQAMESAISLDPRQVSLHIQFGDALVRLGQEAAGQAEYKRALELDNALPEQEPRRLPAARRRELEKKAGR